MGDKLARGTGQVLACWAKGLKSESLWMPPGLPVSAKSLSEGCLADFSSRSGDDWS